MKKSALLLLLISAIILAACAGVQGQSGIILDANESGALQADLLPDIITHSFMDISLCIPASWEIYEKVTPGDGFGGYTFSLRDMNSEALRWGDFDWFTGMTIHVATEPWALSEQTVQEYIDFHYESLISGWKERDFWMTNGVQIGMVSNSRPYPGFITSQIYFRHGAKDYFIGIHYEYTDEEIAAAVREIIKSITILVPAVMSGRQASAACILQPGKPQILTNYDNRCYNSAVEI